MRNRLIRIAALALLAGCGGGDGGPAPTGGGATSSPTPTPTTGVIPDPGGAKLGGLVIPGSLSGLAVCTQVPPSRADGRVVDVSNGDLNTANLSINVDTNFTYAIDMGGFGGPTFKSSDRRGGLDFEVFTADGEELQITKTSTTSSTFGLFTNVGLCFFAAAPFFPSTGAINARHYYGGFTDGLTQIAGDNDRLYASLGEMYFDPATSRYNLTIYLRSVENPFAEMRGQPSTSLGRATASLTLTGRTFEDATISGPLGLPGTVSGKIGGENDQAALLTFRMKNAAGDQIWGVFSADWVFYLN